MITVRPEQPEDHAAVFEVNRRAFDTDAEARLVEALRPVARPLCSLVAVEGGQVVGHILFTPVTVAGTAGAMALGPMAVVPEHQRRGIGSRLVRAGLDACRALGASVVFVLGHAAYYPRFGFRPAAPLGLRYKHPDFDPHFMVIELRPGALHGMTGEVVYHPAFEAA